MQPNGGIYTQILKDIFLLNLMKGLKAFTNDICIDFYFILYIFDFCKLFFDLEVIKVDELRIFGLQMIKAKPGSNIGKDSNFIHCNIEFSLNRANSKFIIVVLQLEVLILYSSIFFVGFDYYFFFVK